MTAYVRKSRRLARAALLAVVPRRLLIERGPPGAGSACLTFDDGPDPDHTPPLLDALHALGVKATFFVIGRKAEAHPDLVRRMAAEGHAVGNHSYDHREPARTSARELLDEVRRTRDVITRLTGATSRLVRPPYGRFTAPKLWGLWGEGQAVVLWNVDPKDFNRQSADEVADWFRQRPVAGGDIVLMHDNVPHPAAVLPELVEQARRGGVSFTTVGEWTG